MRTVAALYVDPMGVYAQMAGVDCWDEQRDARLYGGPHPVVAHPPCAHYGALRHLAKRDDADCGPIAVGQVRRFGGVLEHPAHSSLFDHCDMPRPDTFPDAHGGRSIEICQCDWGHVARKRTWLYFVAIASVGQLPPTREPTHWIGGGRTVSSRRGGPIPPGVKACSAQQRRRTPPLFAEWLVSLARRATTPASRGGGGA